MSVLSTALLALTLAAGVYWYINTPCYSPNVFVSRPNISYDYIVVGAGSAGAVIANRLSEDHDVTVLLVEAGGDDRDNFYMASPGLAALMGLDPNAVSQFRTEPDERFKGLKNRQLVWPRGRILGGSSSINFMAYVRGSRHDFDQWASYTRDKTWSYTHVLPYFLKSERMSSPELADSLYHNTEGPLGVTTIPVDDSPLFQPITKGFQEMGLDYNKDYNGKDQEGVGPLQLTTYKGKRSSTSRAFLHPILDRANLDIAVNAKVQKVAINDKKEAYGVEMVMNGRKFFVRANKEIVLSAGAIQSPQILMLSGIGPKEHLKKLGIPEKVNLPVGQNLIDHVLHDTMIATGESYERPGMSLPPSWWSYLQYVLFNTGPLSFFAHGLQAFVPVTNIGKEKKWPDLQVMVITSGLRLNGQYLKQMNFEPDLIEDLSYRDDIISEVTCLPVLLRPSSRGELKLKSSDPFDDPLIYPNYYSTTEDLDIMVKGVEVCKKLSQTKAMTSIGAKWVDDKCVAPRVIESLVGQPEVEKKRFEHRNMSLYDANLSVFKTLFLGLQPLDSEALFTTGK